LAGSKEASLEAVERAIGPAVTGRGYELVLLEIGRSGGQQVLRLYIDKPGGVTLGDCELISREVEPILDAEDFFSGRYLLEVSSPGLDRPIRRAEDFARFTGRRAKLELRAPLEGRRRLVGTIEGIEGERVKMRLEKGELFEVALSELKKANLIWEGEGPPKAP
jgi:ribosome maturation factor RimP